MCDLLFTPDQCTSVQVYRRVLAGDRARSLPSPGPPASLSVARKKLRRIPAGAKATAISAGNGLLRAPTVLAEPRYRGYFIGNGLSGFRPAHYETLRPAMLLEKLRTYFQTSPAVSLLRSPNAPFILDFLIQIFKQAGRITIPYSELHAALLAYREGILESYPVALQGKIETYLSGWCSQETRWLHRFLETGRNEPVYQLTPHTEDALAFLDRVLQQDFGFVGTESRLRLVIETLGDLVIGASDDPEIRLGHLRNEKQRIEREIAQIEAEGVVKRYQPVQIRERFATAVSLLKQLQGDFR